MLKKLGFVQFTNEHGIYVKGEGESRVFLALYVDDILLVWLDNKGSGEGAGQIWPALENQRVKQRGRKQSGDQTGHSSRTSLGQHGADVHQG